MKKEYLECGRVCNAHGVRGMLKVESWCDSPKVLASRKRVFLADKDGEFRETRVLASSVSGNLVLMQIEGIDTRESAIAMKNTVLFLHRSDIPLGKGQMLIADMLGLSVIDAASGRRYGEIVDVTDAPRGKLYHISTPTGIVIYPSGDQFVKEIDEERGMLITPIPGFFDDDEI
ncbi:MAG: 16S rRNA processing protein RimM [Clostridia bacterium]|nr:16S rRNA processing protein RimM [Clostridia bacterium]